MALSARILLLLFAALTMGCYNTYFVTTTELQKLESTAEPIEVVEIFGDCPQTASLDHFMHLMVAQADDDYDPLADILGDRPTDEEEPTTDAPDTRATTPTTPVTATPPGCTRVEVSTANAVNILTTDGGRERVTPFNFIMSGGQLVSPEYDLLLRMQDVQGAEVSEFSTWKTVGTIVGVSAVAIGTFVTISILAPESDGIRQ